MAGSGSRLAGDADNAFIGTLNLNEYTTQLAVSAYRGNGNTVSNGFIATNVDVNNGSGVNLACDMFDSVTLDGRDLWLDLSDIAKKDTLDDSAFFTLSFGSLDELGRVGSNALVNTQNLSIVVSLDGKSYDSAARRRRK